MNQHLTDLDLTSTMLALAREGAYRRRGAMDRKGSTRP